MRIISECSICHKKNVLEKSHKNIGSKRFITLECNHLRIEDLLGTGIHSDYTLEDGRKLYPFQVEGLNLIESSNFRCQISDEMGLGKTIQAVAAIKEHYGQLTPILIVCKSSLTYNWFTEIIRGTGKIAQIFESGGSIIPSIGITIVSFDTITPREMKNKVTGVTRINSKNLDTLKANNFKTFIIDECQMIKNHNAKRTNAIRDLIRDTKTITITSDLDEKDKSSRVDKYESIALDLMNYHGISNRFTLGFSKLAKEILGLTRIRVEGEGIIKGEIILSKSHIEKDSENEIIETILHEIAHAITPGAGHTKIWQDTSKSIGGNGQAVKYCDGTISANKEEKIKKNIISLSGTPIKNNAIEYFPILNLLRPEMFPSLNYFERNYVDYYWSGKSYKAGGIKYPEEFLGKTKDFIIRRTRKEVLPDLPSIQRDYKYYPLSDVVKKSYNRQVMELAKLMNEERGTSFQVDLLAKLSILRHITGLAKIEPILEFIDEFVNVETGNGLNKLVLFHHHIDVGDVIGIKLKESGIKYSRIISQDDSIKRIETIESFKSDDNRVLIIPTLAGGEGLNIQFINKAIILEREWNPANEEQAEGRFSRIGSEFNSVTITYPVAIGTIDEYFAELVERKREIVGKTLDGKSNSWDQSTLMIELAEKVISKWSL